MGLKIWIVNLMLAVGAAFLGARSYDAWSRQVGEAPPPAQPAKVAAYQAQKPVAREVPPETEFEALAEKNLFSPERKEPLPAEEPAKEEAPEPDQAVGELKVDGRKIFLYGVVIADEYRAALITNPERQADKRSQSWVKLGDTVEGFKVAAIENERVLLAAEGKEYEMLLFDKEKPRTQVAVAAPSPPRPGPAVPGKDKAAVAPQKSDRGSTPGGERKDFSPVRSPTDRDPRRRSAEESARNRRTVRLPKGYGKFQGQLK